MLSYSYGSCFTKIIIHCTNMDHASSSLLFLVRKTRVMLPASSILLFLVLRARVKVHASPNLLSVVKPELCCLLYQVTVPCTKRCMFCQIYHLLSRGMLHVLPNLLFFVLRAKVMVHTMPNLLFLVL